jgi:hypothetical protein
MYVIQEYSKQQAKKLGVELRLSSNPKKKIDVYKGNKKVASIGATGYGDYATFLKTKGKAYADERRRLYKIRHKGEEKKIGSNGYYAWKILW